MNICVCVYVSVIGGDLYMFMCILIYVCLFVCLFERVNQSVPTTIGSGLQGPQGPFSTTFWAIGTFFL